MDISTESRNHFGPNVVLGLAVLALGLALLLDRLHVIDAWDILQFWPLLVVLFGASIVWQSLRGGSANGQKRERMFISPGLILLVVFIALFARHSDSHHFNHTSTNGDDTTEVSAILGESQLVSTATQFHGADMTSVMGNSELDLRQSKISAGESAVIEVFSLMGNINLLVPKDWVVEADVVPVLGREHDFRSGDPDNWRDDWRGNWRDYRNRRRADQSTAPVAPAVPAAPAPPLATSTPGTAPSAAAASARPPRLIIHGSVIMGNLSIRS